MAAARGRGCEPAGPSDCLTGGHGSLLNTLAGVLVLGVIANGMTLLNLSFNVQLLVQGLILVAAVAFDARSRRVGR